MKIPDAGTSEDSSSHAMLPPSIPNVSDLMCDLTSKVADMVSDVSTEYANSEGASSEVDESELGEFLMDTFDAIDPFAVTGLAV